MRVCYLWSFRCICTCRFEEEVGAMQCQSIIRGCYHRQPALLNFTGTDSFKWHFLCIWCVCMYVCVCICSVHVYVNMCMWTYVHVHVCCVSSARSCALHCFHHFVCMHLLSQFLIISWSSKNWSNSTLRSQVCIFAHFLKQRKTEEIWNMWWCNVDMRAIYWWRSPTHPLKLASRSLDVAVGALM